MSISPASSIQPASHMRAPARSSAAGSAAAGAAMDSIANTGSVSADNMGAFFKSFSADLQAMLSHGGNTQTAASKPLADPHHHRNPFNEGGAGPVRDAATQLTGNIGRALKAYGAAGKTAHGA